ncbi:Ectonucleoside triphosphate diphosphohydrolase 1 [Schistosoma japonicum]|uniref:Ectonucleoside triphosphate diphosphohydrolase 1 n=2 Tax=Schistosoma japonicum TaxID=6182 RepID=A0A4Z2CUH1_SCHJA|nr:Ectonucleoside triphosphate diphosphohydrolase 1 [Schistosoma japonicum]
MNSENSTKKFHNTTDQIHFSQLGTDQEIHITDTTLYHQKTMECNTNLQKTLKFLASVILVLSLSGLLIVIILYILSCNIPDMYSVVIDAGSTSSKLHLYKWVDEPFRSNGKVIEVTNEKVSPGISDYIDEPIKSYETMEPKLTKLTASLSVKQKKHTPVYLAATAGMRLKLIEDPLGSLDLFSVIRQYLRQSGLQIETPNERIRLLYGGEEGLYGWVSVNYILGNIREGKRTSPSETVGSLDLGGASTQIAFIPEEYSRVPKEQLDFYPLRLYGNDFLVYSHSFLCYGKSEFERRLMTSIVVQFPRRNSIPNPCFLQGYRSDLYNAFEWFSGSCLSGNYVRKAFAQEVYRPTNMNSFSFHGTGDPDTCVQYMEKHFQTKCNFSSCSFNNVFQPPPSGNFLAYSGFSYVMRYLFPKRNTGLTLTEVTNAVMNFCRKPWKDVAKITKVSDHEFTAKYCFDGLYIINLLKMYGFTTDELWKTITFDSKVNDKSVSWALGYMLDQSGHLPSESPKVSISTKLFIIIFILLFLLMIGSIIGMIVTRCLLSQTKKPTNQV